ncbi:MAG: hypothetical protein WCG08_07790 [Paludibacter sp.]
MKKNILLLIVVFSISNIQGNSSKLNNESGSSSIKSNKHENVKSPKNNDFRYITPEIARKFSRFLLYKSYQQNSNIYFLCKDAICRKENILNSKEQDRILFNLGNSFYYTSVIVEYLYNHYTNEMMYWALRDFFTIQEIDEIELLARKLNEIHERKERIEEEIQKKKLNEMQNIENANTISEIKRKISKNFIFEDKKGELDIHPQIKFDIQSIKDSIFKYSKENVNITFDLVIDTNGKISFENPIDTLNLNGLRKVVYTELKKNNHSSAAIIIKNDTTLVNCKTKLTIYVAKELPKEIHLIVKKNKKSPYFEIKEGGDKLDENVLNELKLNLESDTKYTMLKSGRYEIKGMVNGCVWEVYSSGLLIQSMKAPNNYEVSFNKLFSPIFLSIILLTSLVLLQIK